MVQAISEETNVLWSIETPVLQLLTPLVKDGLCFIPWIPGEICGAWMLQTETRYGQKE